MAIKFTLNEMFNDYFQIEHRMNNIIVKHIRPQNKEQFEKIILNSSILDWGKKIKILNNIENLDSKVISKLGELGRIRNAFAHVSSTPHIKITHHLDKTKNNITIIADDILEVMNADGKIKTKSSNDLKITFKKLSVELREELDNFINQMPE